MGFVVHHVNSLLNLEYFELLVECEACFHTISSRYHENAGMPKKYEKYYSSKDYAIINVPPPILSKAKIYMPGRLCAIYEISHEAPDQKSEENLQE